MKKNRRLLVFFFTALAAFCCLCALYVAAVNVVSANRTARDTWLSNMYWLKHGFAQKIAQPKIIILGGSASLFSVHSPTIEKMSGMPVVNLALHAAMPFRFYLTMIRNHVKKGDVVVLPLEPCHHYADQERKLYSDFSLDLLFGVDRAFQSTLTFSQFFNLYAGYGCQQIDRMFCDKRVVRSDPAAVYDLWQTAATNRVWSGYSLTRLNSHGDLDMPFGLKRDLPKKGCAATVLSSEFLEVYGVILHEVLLRGGRICLTYSNLSFYLDQVTLRKLAMLLQQHGIVIHGNPALYCFPHRYYYDTVFHMSGAGARLYSRELAKTICHFMGRPYVMTSGERAVSFREHPESISFGGVKRWYPEGIRLTNELVCLSFVRPPEFADRDCTCELILDRGGANGKTVRRVKSGKMELTFVETPHLAKNVLMIYIPKGSGRLPLTIELKKGVSVGLERAFFDEDIDTLPFNFTEPDRGNRITFLSGFSVAYSQHGMWTDGKIARLKMNLGPRAKEDVTLSFDVAPSASDQEVLVRSHGHEVGHWKFVNYKKVTFPCRIPKSCIVDGVVELEFEMKKTVCPKELGTSKDKRHLGIRFFSAHVTTKE